MGGTTALPAPPLTPLCALISVVNIDNGYGAALRRLASYTCHGPASFRGSGLRIELHSRYLMMEVGCNCHEDRYRVQHRTENDLLRKNVNADVVPMRTIETINAPSSVRPMLQTHSNCMPADNDRCDGRQQQLIGKVWGAARQARRKYDAGESGECAGQPEGNDLVRVDR